MWAKYANSGSRSRQGRQPYKRIRVAHAPPDLEPFKWLRQQQYAAQHHHCSPGPAASARANKPPSRFCHGFVTVLSITSRASCKVISYKSSRPVLSTSLLWRNLPCLGGQVVIMSACKGTRRLRMVPREAAYTCTTKVLRLASYLARSCI